MIPKGQFAQSADISAEPAANTSLRTIASQTLVSNSNRSILLFGFLILLAITYTLYLTKTLLLPIIVSGFISALLSPIVYRLERLKIPRPIASAALLTLLIGLGGLAGNSVIPAALDFSQNLPQALGQIDETVAAMSSKLDAQSDSLAQTSAPPEQAVSKKAVTYITYEFFLSAPVVAVQLLSIVFLVYFILVFGHRLFRKVVAGISEYSTRRMAITSMIKIQRNITRYVLVISIINIGLGISLSIALWLAGIENYLLWGVAACLMNFVPYIGPLITALALSFGVYMEMNSVDAAFIALGFYALLNLIESQLVTPLALSSQLRLNPLLLFLWVILWGWLWGAAGMFICVPLLVCLKIILSTTLPNNSMVNIIES